MVDQLDEREDDCLAHDCYINMFWFEEGSHLRKLPFILISHGSSPCLRGTLFNSQSLKTSKNSEICYDQSLGIYRSEDIARLTPSAKTISSMKLWQKFPKPRGKKNLNENGI